MPDANAFESVRDHLACLQDSICAGLEGIDGSRFREDLLDGTEGSLHRPRVLADGPVIEKAAVHFSSSAGRALPPAATEHRPELAGREYRAASVSLIVHPRNPKAPTSHANFRYFEAGGTWWFGGGFDLTPYYGFVQDCVHWHRTAATALAPFGEDRYPQFKNACDEYTTLESGNDAIVVQRAYPAPLRTIKSASWKRAMVSTSGSQYAGSTSAGAGNVTATCSPPMRSAKYISG